VLNSFIAEKNLMYIKVQLPDGTEIAGADFCERLRGYYIFRHKQGVTAAKWQKVTQTCSKFMRATVASQMHSSALRSVRALHQANDQMLVFLATKVQSQVFSVQDHVVMPDDDADCLFLVERGSVLVRGTKLVGQGKSFGEEVMSTQSGAVRGYSAVCMADTVLLTLDRKTLNYAIEHFAEKLFRARLKFECTLRQLIRALKRATKLVLSTLDVKAGLELLVQALGTDMNIALAPHCPLRGIWEVHCSRRFERLKVSGEGGRGSHWKIASTFAKQVDQITAGFRKLEKRQKFRAVVAAARSSHIAAMTRFLAGKHFGERSTVMVGYLDLLHTQHSLTVPLLRKASPSDLVAVGIPLSDALFIYKVLGDYPIQPVDTQRLPPQFDWCA